MILPDSAIEKDKHERISFKRVTRTDRVGGAGMKKLTLPWQGIQVKITYQPHYSDTVLHIQGYQLAHIEVRANTPLPITQTGYRSVFLPEAEVQEAGGVVAYVYGLLTEAAKSKEWQEYVKQKNQLTLF